MPNSQAIITERETWPAVWKGWRRRCPCCGQGPLMAGYLKVNRTCTVCRTELFHHRADDGPAYLTILIVGHIMAPLIHLAFVQWRPDPLVMFTGFAIVALSLSLYLLPRLKGVVIAIQWARQMYGFGKGSNTP